MSLYPECTYFFNSRLHPGPPAECAQAIDLARDPSAAHVLIRLGLSTRNDLPALLQAEAGGKLRVLGLRLTPVEAEGLARGEGLGGDVVLYGSSWCPDCRRAKRVLDEAGISYRDIVIDEDLKAECLVLERSGGRRVVPTILFGGRVFAFNPEPAVLRQLASASLDAGDPVDDAPAPA